MKTQKQLSKTSGILALIAVAIYLTVVFAIVATSAMLISKLIAVYVVYKLVKNGWELSVLGLAPTTCSVRATIINR